jgi:hypothetical protein
MMVGLSPGLNPISNIYQFLKFFYKSHEISSTPIFHKCQKIFCKCFSLALKIFLKVVQFDLSFKYQLACLETLNSMPNSENISVLLVGRVEPSV